MWPCDRTAVVIIHGMGHQSAFDNLDSFVRTLVKVLKESNRDGEILPWHRFAILNQRRESYLSPIKDGDEASDIDVYEYF